MERRYQERGVLTGEKRRRSVLIKKNSFFFCAYRGKKKMEFTY